MVNPRLFVVALVLIVVMPAQNVWRELALRAPIRPPLTKNAVEETLEKRALKTAGQLQHPAGRQDIERVRSSLRKRLTESLGHRRLPWPPELRATVLGTVRRAGYHIEKLGYQTLRNVLVPAHVYVPDILQTAAPAILLIAGGHIWKQGKTDPEAQTFAINMARLGFIVMVPDPLGAGERGPAGDYNPQALLAGLSQPGIIQYETQCALEYLLLRKDVDPKKVGITGVDGGGFDTWLTIALDDRVSAAVPVDDTFDFADEIQRARPNDWNSLRDAHLLVPGILQYANVHELIALTAPRPLMIVAAPDARPIFEYGRRLYASFDEARRIRMFESEGAAYARPRRQAAYGFFLQVLLNRGDGSPTQEAQTQVEPTGSPELVCLRPDQRAPTANAIAQAVRQLAARGINAETELSPRVLAGDAPPLGNASLGINPFPVHRRNLGTEEGIEVPLTILRPGFDHAGGHAGTLLAIYDKDKESLASDPIVEEALRRDYLVVEMDARGFGELSIDHPK